MSAPTFGALLRAHRERAGLSRAALARQVAIDPGYFGRMERDERPPPAALWVIVQLADWLTVNARERAHFFCSAGRWPDRWPRRLIDAVDAIQTWGQEATDAHP